MSLPIWRSFCNILSRFSAKLSPATLLLPPVLPNELWFFAPVPDLKDDSDAVAREGRLPLALPPAWGPSGVAIECWCAFDGAMVLD